MFSFFTVEILYVRNQNACALNENNKKEQKRKDTQREATWWSVHSSETGST